MPKKCADSDWASWLGSWPIFLRKFAAWFLQTQTCDAPKAKAGQMQRWIQAFVNVCLWPSYARTKMNDPEEVLTCTCVLCEETMAQTLHRTRLRRRNGRRSERWNLRAARHFHNKWLWWQVTNPGIHLVIPDSLFLLLGFHSSIQMPIVCARPADRFTLSNG